MNALLQFYPGDRVAVLAGYVVVEIMFLVALAWLVARHLARGRPAVRYGVWLCALTCVVLSPLTTLLLDRTGLALWAVPVLRDAAEPLAEVATPLEIAPAGPRSALARQVFDPASLTDERMLPGAAWPPARESQSDSQVEPAAVTAPAPAIAQPARPPAAPHSRAERLRAAGGAMVAAWLAGITFFLMRLVRGWWIVAMLRRDAMPITNGPVVEVLTLVRRRLRLTCLPRVVTSHRIGGPIVVGVVRPMVILPQEAIPTLGPHEMHDILVHECAHVVRRDHWVSLLQRVVEMFFWPHVLVHYLNRQLSRTREEVCDNYVLGSGDAPAYARTLLTLSENASLGRPTPAGIGLLQPRWRLEDRVAGLLDTRRDLMLRMSRAAVGAVVVAFLAVTVLVAGTKLTQRAGPIAASPASEETATTHTRNAQAVEENDDSVVVRGRVLDPDGKPLAGATVRAQTPRWVMYERVVSEDFQPPMSEVKADDDGRFTVSFTKQPFGDLSRLDRQWQEIWKKTRIAAVAPGFGPGWVEYEKIEPDRLVTLRLVRDVPIRGRVVDLEGNPIAGARVKLGLLWAAEDEDMSAWLEAARDGQVRWTVGQLTPKRVDAGFVDVPESVTTDEQGRFVIHGIGRERNVELAFQGERVAHTSVTVVTRPIEPFELLLSPEPAQEFGTVFGAEFTFAATPSRPVEGTVVDAQSGEPLVGVSVESYARHASHRVLKTTTDEQGRFRLVSMPKGERNRLMVLPADEQPYFMQEIGVPNPPGLEPATVEIQLHRGIWITGRVTDKVTGAPVHARVHYLPLLSNKYAQAIPEFDGGHADGDPLRYQTRSDGTYRLVGLPGPAIVGAQSVLQDYRYGVGADEIDVPMHQEPYEWEAHFPTYRNPTQPSRKWPNVMRQIDPPADADSVEVDLEMDAGLSVRINMVDAAGRPITGVQVADGRSPPGASETADTFTFEALHFGPEDQRTLIFHHQGRNLGWVARVGPSDAGAGPITVKLQPCATLTGRLLREDGTPYANLEIQAYVLPAEDYLATLPPVTTDSDGRFRYTMMSGGKYWIRARWLGVTIYDELTVKPGETKDLGELTYAGEHGFVGSPEANAKPKQEPPQSNTEKPSPQSRPQSALSPSQGDHTVTVTGRILDANNKPLTDAHVAAIAMRVGTARGGDLGSSGEVLAQGVTDESGQYELRLEGVSSRTHDYANLIVRKDGFGIAWHKLNLDGTRIDGLLTLTPDEPIRGRLIDIEGQPAAGVRLLIRAIVSRTDDGRAPSVWGAGVGFQSQSHPAAWLAPITTDEQGWFTIRGVPPGHGVLLDVEGGDRFAPQGIALNTGITEQRGERDATYRSLVKNAEPGEEIVLALSPAQVFEGVVTYEDTGAPAAHARLTIWASQQEYGSMSLVAGRADTEGRYRISVKPGIRFGVTAYPADGVPYLARQTDPSKPIRWDAGDVVKQVNVSLPRGVLVRGRVREAETGAPLAGASIQYHPESLNNANVSDDILTGWQGIQLSDEDGQFEIAVLPGPGRLLAHGPNAEYVLQEIGHRVLWSGGQGGQRYYAHAIEKIEPVPDAESVEVNLQLRRGVTIAGNIVSQQGERIEEVFVFTRLKIAPNILFWRGHTTPTLGGRFEIEGAEEGKEYPVHFLDPERRLGATAMLKAGDGEATVVLYPCGQAHLRLVDGEGRPVADHDATVRMVVTPGVYRSDGAALRNGALAADSDFIGNIDRTNYPTWTKSDAQGNITLPALIPGATYRVVVQKGQDQEIAREFQGRANETLELGDIVVETDSNL